MNSASNEYKHEPVSNGAQLVAFFFLLLAPTWDLRSRKCAEQTSETKHDHLTSAYLDCILVQNLIFIGLYDLWVIIQTFAFDHGRYVVSGSVLFRDAKYRSHKADRNMNMSLVLGSLG